MSNFGAAGNLVIGGRHYDTGKYMPAGSLDRGSIIIILGTDIPMSERQLKRTAKHSVIALARTGSCCGNGSGDIALAFTTANQVPHYSGKDILPMKMFYDEHIDAVFEAAAEAVEEAILSSLYHGETMTGIRGKYVMGCWILYKNMRVIEVSSMGKKKYFISADLEGICDVTAWCETEKGCDGYAQAQIQMSRETAAACEAILEAGHEVVVRDGHDSARNIFT